MTEKQLPNTLSADSLTIQHKWVVHITDPLEGYILSPEFGPPGCRWMLCLKRNAEHGKYYALWLHAAYTPNCPAQRDTDFGCDLKNAKGSQPPSVAAKIRNYSYTFKKENIFGSGWGDIVKVSEIANPDTLSITVTITAKDVNGPLRKKDLSDVELDVREDKEEINGNHHLLPAHKAILAAHSDRFAEMFTPESQNSSSINPIKITGFSLPIVKSMLDHIYNGEMRTHPPETFEQRLELLALADQYQLTHLFEQVSEMIVATDLNIDTAVRICCVGIERKRTSEGLKIAASEFKREHKGEIFNKGECAGWWKEYGDEDVSFEAMKELITGDVKK